MGSWTRMNAPSRDADQEQRINDAWNAYATGPREQRQTLWDAFKAEVAKRSPEQVEAMERAKGLR